MTICDVLSAAVTGLALLFIGSGVSLICGWWEGPR